MHAPCSTRKRTIARLLQEAAQCNGVLQETRGENKPQQEHVNWARHGCFPYLWKHNLHTFVPFSTAFAKHKNALQKHIHSWHTSAKWTVSNSTVPESHSAGQKIPCYWWEGSLSCLQLVLVLSSFKSDHIFTPLYSKIWLNIMLPYTSTSPTTIPSLHVLWLKLCSQFSSVLHTLTSSFFLILSC